MRRWRALFTGYGFYGITSRIEEGLASSTSFGSGLILGWQGVTDIPLLAACFFCVKWYSCVYHIARPLRLCMYTLAPRRAFLTEQPSVEHASGILVARIQDKTTCDISRKLERAGRHEGASALLRFPDHAGRCPECWSPPLIRQAGLRSSRHLDEDPDSEGNRAYPSRNS